MARKSIDNGIVIKRGILSISSGSSNIVKINAKGVMTISKENATNVKRPNQSK